MTPIGDDIPDPVMTAELEDGCQMQMLVTKGDTLGWLLTIPHGFTVRCAHGFEVGLDLDKPLKLAETKP